MSIASSSKPPGALGSTFTLPVTTIEDSCPSLAARSNTSSVTLPLK